MEKGGGGSRAPHGEKVARVGAGRLKKVAEKILTHFSPAVI